MKIVVVESPAKAKTINKYLGSDFHVVASYGHIRDLPAKDGSVRPDQSFAMDWEVDGRSEKHIREIAKLTKGAERLYLATDPDREGEAISWHVQEELTQRGALKGLDVKRVVFNEITKTAVLDAMKHPRDVNRELVDAYLARRALDYLVGFTLSPVLWRKLPGSRSAGRVQSVALRLICERESEIEDFKPQEYWTVEADFAARGEMVTAQLTHLDGARLDKFTLGDEKTAQAAVATIERGRFHVGKIERKQAKRHPFAPFTTSTLQQEASRKLGFSAKQTMQVAQKLYEGVDIGGETVGLITYMRTDGVSMSTEAVAAARNLIGQLFGRNYVPAQPRLYKVKTKNAQEAHEAIRPTDLNRRPGDVAAFLDESQRRLYELVWKRTMASQMESAVLDQVAVDVTSADEMTSLRATGSVVLFDGFLRLYTEDRDEPSEEDAERRLPNLREGEDLERRAVRPLQHVTQPPPRFTEASLVKRLEELGIGRPSTYASILSVLQERDYVRLEKKRFIPEDRGRLVTAFLTSFFERYVQYNFTAELEERLDDIAGGRLDWKQVLEEFWRDFSAAVGGTKDLTITQVLDSLDAELGPHFFPDDGSGRDARVCPTCGDGRLSLKLGKFGAFIGCSHYPECRYTRPLAVEGGNGGEGEAASERELGVHDGQTVLLKKGPYGFYVQLGTGEKPKRASLPRGEDPASLGLNRAVGLLSLPRELGPNPETGKPVSVGIGRFGPYVKHEATYKSLERGDDVLSVDLPRALELLEKAKAKGEAKEIGPHPKGGMVTLHSGRFGPYVRHGRVMASLPKGKAADSLTLEEALALLAAKAPAGKTTTGKATTTRAKSAKGAKAEAGAEGAPEAKAAKTTKATKTAKAKPAAPKTTKATTKTTTKAKAPAKTTKAKRKGTAAASAAGE